MFSHTAVILCFCFALGGASCLADASGLPEDVNMPARRTLQGKPKNSEPVCAKNLQTGKNSTYASPAKATKAKDFILFRGACPNVQPLQQFGNCPCQHFSLLNVCATYPEDGITQWVNDECTAACDGATILYNGKCKNPGSVKGQDCDCGTIASPVCATPKGGKSKKKTYPNLCTASCSGATGYTPGKCPA